MADQSNTAIYGVWQPIETAPRNRKIIAGYFNENGKWRTVMACYHTSLPWSDDQDPEDDSEYAPEGWYEECENSEVIYFTCSPPTHWMPLPPAPSQDC